MPTVKPTSHSHQLRRSVSRSVSPLNRPSEPTWTNPAHHEHSPPRHPQENSFPERSGPPSTRASMNGRQACEQSSRHTPQRDSCQVSSRDSRNRRAAKTPLPQEPVKRTHTKACGPEKLGSRPLAVHSPPAHERAGSQAISGRAENSPAKPPRAPPPLQERRRRRTMRPADSRIAATDSTPIATPVTGSHRSRTLWAAGRLATLVTPFAPWLLPAAPTTTSCASASRRTGSTLHPATAPTSGCARR